MFGIYLRCKTNITLNERFTRLSNELKKTDNNLNANGDSEANGTLDTSENSKHKDDFNSIQLQLCNGKENITKSITNDARRDFRKNKTCYFCYCKGHIKSECAAYQNNGNRSQPPWQYQVAHFSNNQVLYRDSITTDHPIGGFNRNLRPLICYNCQLEGHKRNECTAPRKPREMQFSNNQRQKNQDPISPDHPIGGFKQNAGVLTCFNCQQQGHKRYQCTAPKQQRETQFSNDQIQNHQQPGNETSGEQYKTDTMWKSRTFYNRKMTQRQSESSNEQNQNETSDNRNDAKKSYRRNQNAYNGSAQQYYWPYSPYDYNSYYNNNYNDYYNYYYYYDYQQKRWNWKHQGYHYNEPYQQDPRRKYTENDNNTTCFYDDSVYIDDEVNPDLQDEEVSGNLT